MRCNVLVTLYYESSCVTDSHKKKRRPVKTIYGPRFCFFLSYFFFLTFRPLPRQYERAIWEMFPRKSWPESLVAVAAPSPRIYARTSFIYIYTYTSRKYGRRKNIKRPPPSSLRRRIKYYNIATALQIYRIVAYASPGVFWMRTFDYLQTARDVAIILALAFAFAAGVPSLDRSTIPPTELIVRAADRSPYYVYYIL